MSDIEIEIQVKIENKGALLDFLKKNGKFIGKNHQADEYFNAPHRDFIGVRPVNEWLRLRDSDGKFSINYKFWHRDKDGKSQYCDEYETVVGDIKKLRKMLAALGFQPLVKVDKTRQTWIYKNYEVGIDSIKGLGDFVEVEFKGSSVKSPKQINADMVGFLKRAGCGKVERNHVGYPFQLLFPDEVEHEVQ